MIKDQNQMEAEDLFSKELWLDHVDLKSEDIAGKPFLKFIVTRKAPVYTHALQRVQTALSEDNPFKGRIDVELTDKPTPFPEFDRGLDLGGNA